jgi:hypothetical protein
MPFTHRFSRATVYLLAVIYASMFLAVAGTIIYTNHVAEQTNRQWCGVLRVFHDAYAHNPPPATQYGRDIQAQIEALYRDFDCASVSKPRPEGEAR